MTSRGYSSGDNDGREAREAIDYTWYNDDSFMVADLDIVFELVASVGHISFTTRQTQKLPILKVLAVSFNSQSSRYRGFEMDIPRLFGELGS
ncbi:hypothetical protein ACH5RR_001319 [Cinchona calisaya]|uniref:Uncharacterized protein n=1 Tax=Cinchona calisaya TaxID=153742 RepID=A0ABD3B367_9GENT